MSNRSNAARYTGNPTVHATPPGPNGLFDPVQGIDWFGTRQRRQNEAIDRYKQFLDYVQQLQQQNTKFNTDEDIRFAASQSEQEQKRYKEQKATELMEKDGVTDTPEHRAAYEGIVQARINTVKSIETRRDVTTASPEGQKTIEKSQLGLLAGPALAAQKSSEVRVQPGEMVGFNPAGDINQPPAVASGMTPVQTIPKMIPDKNAPNGFRYDNMEVRTMQPGKFPLTRLSTANPPPDPQQTNFMLNPPGSFNYPALNLMPAPDSNAAMQGNAGSKPAVKPMPPSPSTAGQVGQALGMTAGQVGKATVDDLKAVWDLYSRYIGQPFGNFTQGVGQGLGF